MEFRESSAEQSAVRVVPMQDSSRISASAFFDALATNPETSLDLANYLRSCPEEAIFWELPPFAHGTSDEPLEFVWISAPSLDRCQPDPQAFAEHFPSSNQGVVRFSNLGRDATLVVPCPAEPTSPYTHLLAFLRSATNEQVLALFAELGRAVQDTLTAEPLWISTAGMGVSWLHLRLDARPKYYRFAEYRNPDWHQAKGTAN